MKNQSKICSSTKITSLSKPQRESHLPLTTNQNETRTATKSSVGEDELSVGSKESYIFEESKVIKIIDKYGVRIHPAVVRFENTFENQSYTETVSVQNISETSVTVRIHNPRAWSFRVTPMERGYLLAPGLKVSRRLHVRKMELSTLYFRSISMTILLIFPSKHSEDKLLWRLYQLLSNLVEWTWVVSR